MGVVLQPSERRRDSIRHGARACPTLTGGRNPSSLRYQPPLSLTDRQAQCPSTRSWSYPMRSIAWTRSGYWVYQSWSPDGPVHGIRPECQIGNFQISNLVHHVALREKCSMSGGQRINLDARPSSPKWNRARDLSGRPKRPGRESHPATGWQWYSSRRHHLHKEFPTDPFCRAPCWTSITPTSAADHYLSTVHCHSLLYTLTTSALPLSTRVIAEFIVWTRTSS